jgi:hypothetical protein
MNNKIERVWKEAAMAQDSRLRYYTRFAYRGWVNHETLSRIAILWGKIWTRISRIWSKSANHLAAISGWMEHLQFR